MSTTIDSLQIEIQSNSANAEQGIRGLAGALGELKKNGSVGTAVKNLNNLSASLKSFTSVTSNANKIGALAGALQQLKNVGSLRGTGSSIEKMAESLRSLTGVNTVALEKVGSAGPVFDRVASALGKLSTIRSGGLSTMVNALGRIGEVTAKLDKKAIDDFGNRVEALSKKLAPLSGKMTTIQAGLSGINTNAKKAATGVSSFNTKISAGALNMSSFITVAQGIVTALQPVINLLTSTISQAIEWDGVAARFGRGFGAQAEETYAWIQKLNEEMGINIQTFMQYSSVFSTMLQGFGVGTEDSAKMALGYTELVYDIWAGYNDVYKNFADAADAVKSAIAGEVEPIRRAGFTIVESTLEQTAANYGLEISLANATEAQKSYLRYLTLVDQAHAQSLVGTYARELNTAEGLMRTFSQQLKSLAQAFGSLFLPVLVKVIPWVQAFVEVLTAAVRAVAAFFGITIQEVDWGSGFSAGASGLGDVANSADDATGSLGSAAKAAEDLKKATLGIDELNVISPPTESGGGGGGAGGGGGSAFDGLDVDSLWEESIFGQIEDKIGLIKEKFEDWLPVIAAIGTALAGLAVVSLISSIGEAIAQMNLLQKLLATVAIVALEAVLVFTFADNYLEGGNLLYLIGEAVATAIGSYLLYKAWGANGLAIGFAVSLAMQLAAITLNLADGGVSMDDPELWIQSAFTAATAAVGGGLLAYKGVLKMGTGQGVLFGALAGLSLTLASITIGNSADGDFGLTEAITGLLSTVFGGAAGAALFTFLGIASGGTGFIIGAAIMLAVNVIGAAIASVHENTEKSMKEDLEERFGNVELSVSDVKVIVNSLIPEWTEGVIQADGLYKEITAVSEHIAKQVAELEKLEWKVSVGLGLTPEEQASYQATIKEFVETTQTWIKDRGYALEVGLKATGASDFVIGISESITSTASGELERLGKKLQDTVNAAYEDGLLDIDELEAIQNIRNDMMEVVNALNASEIEAEISMLKMTWSGVDLTPDSFDSMLTEWNNTIQEKVKPALESTVKENLKTLEGNVAFAKVQLEKTPGDEEAKEMLEQAEKALQEYMDSNPLENLMLEANVEAVTFALNTLKDAFAEEIARVEAEGYLEYDNTLEFALNVRPDVVWDNGSGEIYGNIAILTSDMQYAMEEASASLSKEARKNLENMLEAMKPTMADFEEIATENRKLGKSVPQSVRDGLNDYNELLALSGDVDGINYMIGQGFSTDPVFLNTLATVEGAGGQIDASVAKGLLNNLDYVTDEATGLVVGIKNSVTGETIAITPTLEKNLSQLGVNMGDALGGKYQYVYDETTGVLKGIIDSATGNQVWVNSELKQAGEDAGSELSAGVLEGAESGMKADKKSWLDWAIWPWNWFKEENEINSPSKLFERGGKNLTDGLKNGMETNSLRDKLTEIWNTAKNWWSGKSALEKAEVAVNLVKDGWKTVKGWIGSIPAVSQGIKLAKSSWSTVKNWIGSIPTLSQSISLMKSGWSTVKNWIGSIPKVDQKVGLIKSGWSTVKNWVGTMPTLNAGIKLVKSGWSSVKSWLGSLNFKLGFTLPKIGINWGTKEVLGFKISYPKSFYTYAKGGFPDLGEMFIAREAGPELVGKIGSKTSVANNDQIVEGISEGVYAAVLAAMRASESNGDRAVNVYLDGRQITSAVEQRQRERGSSIMGRQVYSY